MSPSKPAPAVSVVIPTYNRADRLDRLFAGLREQDGVEFEVVVVDNGSADSTAETLAQVERESGLPLRVIRLDPNRGPAGAREAGWRAAAAPVIAFTDDDCRPATDWLAAGLAAVEANPGAIVQGMTHPEPDELYRLGPYSRTIDVSTLDPVFPTCNMFYPREVLERIGGFDLETFSYGFEDSDLAWRAIDAGAQPVFEPGALVFHEVADLGPVGKLRLAAGWSDGMAAHVRHPELRRRTFYNRFFWKGSHYLLVRALAALLLRGRLRWIAPWLVWPYLRALLERARLEGGGPGAVPYLVLYDLVEVWMVARAALRFRTPML